MGNERKIFYAGRSPRRVACLEQIPGSEVIAIGGGKEPNTPFVREVVIAKLSHAKQAIEAQGHHPNQVIVAADTRTELVAINSKGETRFINCGKPPNLLSVQNNLRRLQAQDNPCYRVVSASGCVNGRTVTSAMACTVELNPEMVQYLSTDSGFRTYRQAFQAFYSQPPYSTNNMPPLQLTDVSAGFSLPVFISLGAVDSVDGVPLPQLRKLNRAIELSAAMLTVAVGISPEILDQISPQAFSSIMAWGWLQEVTEHLL